MNEQENQSTPISPVSHVNIDEQIAKEDMENLKAQFVKTIETAAFIGITAKSMGLKESTIYRWMRDDREFAAAVRHAQTRQAERIGLTLINKAIEEKDTQALIFLCKTLGKNLGFDEKMPSVNINIGTQPDFDVSGLSMDEREQLLTLVRKSKQQDLLEAE